MRQLHDITSEALAAIKEIGRPRDDARARTAALEKIGACLAGELEQVLPGVSVLDARDRNRRKRHVGAR